MSSSFAGIIELRLGLNLLVFRTRLPFSLIVGTASSTDRVSQIFDRGWGLIGVFHFTKKKHYKKGGHFGFVLSFFTTSLCDPLLLTSLTSHSRPFGPLTSYSRLFTPSPCFSRHITVRCCRLFPIWHPFHNSNPDPFARWIMTSRNRRMVPIMIRMII